MNIKVFIGLLSGALAFLPGCSIQHRIQKIAGNHLLKDEGIRQSHIGISLYDPDRKERLFDHNGSAFFIPASNIKIVTCYAALKYLGDSIAGMRYMETEKALFWRPTGDPTFLHPDFPQQPIIDFLRQKAKPVVVETTHWKSTAWGPGWSWDDYDQAYMPERSPLPVYGNVLKWHQEADTSVHETLPGATPAVTIYSIPEVNWKVRFQENEMTSPFSVSRLLHANEFIVRQGPEKTKSMKVPFITNGAESAVTLLTDSLPMGIKLALGTTGVPSNYHTLSTRPLDSILEPMMHRSDNFFAEQLLLMVSEKILGEMDMDRVIDSILRTDLSDLPQRPRWADGSGLSRYNLFTPQDMLAILDKMHKDVGMDRMKLIFPSGGEGTLSTHFQSQKGTIYAKTGTLSGVVTLSGYLWTAKKKWILFSIMINNHRGNTSAIRKKMEAFLSDLQKKL